MKRILAMLWLGLAGLPGPAAAQDDVGLTATLDRSQVEVGDEVVLTVTVTVPDRSAVENLELPEHEELEQLARHQASRTRFSLGMGGSNTEHSLVHTLRLRALAAGDLTLSPAVLHYAGRVYRTPPIHLTVVPSGRLGARAPPSQPSPGTSQDPFGGIDPFEFPDDQGRSRKDDVILRVGVDRDTVWLGEQVTLVIQVLSRLEVADFQGIRIPDLEGAWVEDLDTPTQIRPTWRTVDGRRYRAYLLRRRALFPTRAGTLTIPSVEVGVVTAFGLFQPGSTVTRRSRPIEVEVRPLPTEGRPDGFSSTNVGQWDLSARLDAEEAQVGQPVTLTLSARGSGNVEALVLPELPELEGAKVYEPTRTVEVRREGNRHGGVKSVEWVVVPSRTGSLTLPALTLHYFDPLDGAYRAASTAPVELAVSAGAPVAGSPGPGGSPRTATNVLEAAGLRPIEYTGELRAVGAPVYRTAWFLGLLFLPVLGVLVAEVALHTRRARRADLDRRAAGVARARLKAARRLERRGDPLGVHAAVERALLDYLTARLAIPARGLSREGLQRALSDRGFPPGAVTELGAVLEEAELARYAPHPPQGAAAHRLVDRAERLMTTLEAVRTVHASEARAGAGGW